MKTYFLFFVCLLSLFLPATAFAARVSKVVITAVEPVVGEVRSFQASVPKTASTEIYEVHWSGEFDKGVFVQGNDYTMTVKLRIKANSEKIFSASGKINATINGKKAKVTKSTEKEITVRYTWKTLGGENPNNPKTKLKEKLAELAAAYVATNADDDKDLLDYLKNRLPEAEIWLAGGSYKYTRKMPSETEDGNISMSIGITCDGVTLDRYSFSVVLPALNKSPEAAMLSADMELMKEALKNFIVTSQTTGDEVLAVVNAAAVNGTSAVWDSNYRYNAPSAKVMGSIDGNILLTLGDKKDYFHAHKTLPIAGTPADAAIDADFSALSKALHNYNPTNKTTQQELLDIANASIRNGSNLTFVDFTKTDATYETEGKIVMRFELENEGKRRSPRIAMRMPKLRPELPTGISLNQDEWEILRLTNIERFKRGRKPLVIIATLQEAADIREKEIVIDYRKDHLRPDGSNFFTAIDPVFKKRRVCGENANKDKYYPSIAMCSWMHSPGHKANILKEEYSYLGAGVYKKGNTKYWIQLFAGGNDIVSAECNTGSNHFDTVFDMEKAYLICTNGDGQKCYVPLDDEYMVKNGNRYTIHLGGISVSVTVGESGSEN